MSNWVRDVKKFQAKFPADYKNSLRERASMMAEELQEFNEAQTDAQRLDAIIDLIYFAIGTATMYDWPIKEAWDLVHAANMQKMVGITKRGFRVDMKKPEGWKPPSIEGLFK